VRCQGALKSSRAEINESKRLAVVVQIDQIGLAWLLHCIESLSPIPMIKHAMHAIAFMRLGREDERKNGGLRDRGDKVGR
jgi:hypothetical protein